MIIKITVLLTMVEAFLVFCFDVWGKSHPLEVIAEEFPWWAYIMAVLIFVDIILIFVSVVWWLFFEL